MHPLPPRPWNLKLDKKEKFVNCTQILTPRSILHSHNPARCTRTQGRTDKTCRIYKRLALLKKPPLPSPFANRRPRRPPYTNLTSLLSPLSLWHGRSFELPFRLETIEFEFGRVLGRLFCRPPPEELRGPPIPAHMLPPTLYSSLFFFFSTSFFFPKRRERTQPNPTRVTQLATPPNYCFDDNGSSSRRSRVSE